MYGIFAYTYHKNQPNVGKYTIHGFLQGVRVLGGCLTPLRIPVVSLEGGTPTFRHLQLDQSDPSPKAITMVKKATYKSSRWWFQAFFIFTSTWGNDPF